MKQHSNSKDEKSSQMKKHLRLNDERIQLLLDIKVKVFKGELSYAEAKKLVNQSFDSITPEEFAYGEQYMLNHGISDEHMTNHMDEVIDIFADVLHKSELNLPKGHSIRSYIDEAKALELLLLKMENQLKQKFIKNQWLELYKKLSQINIHFSRKQNQLFSILEQKGFDRPSKVMWTFDNNVRDAIKNAFTLLREDNDKAFIAAQKRVIELVRDILDKENAILYPTALQLISEEEFAAMRSGDDEIGYCLIDTPPKLSDSKTEENNTAMESNFMKDLSGLLNKYGMTQTSQKEEVLDVSMGKLSLEQINLIFRHLPIDLSYVDENDIVKFYSDTKHRVFPRSAGVIGREVQNCHPRESVGTVEEIIAAFRSGEQDQAEFWLEMGGQFIYIIYNAVRDDQGNFRGVLEMMQNATHIRSLTGSQKLLSWDHQPKADSKEEKEADLEISGKTKIGVLLKQYPFLKPFLIGLNPKFERLNNPIIFKTMETVATIERIADRGGFSTEELIEKLQGEIQRKNKC